MSSIKIGLVGCGSIGTFLARHMDREKGFELLYLLDADRKKSRNLAGKLKKRPRIVKAIEEMEDADLIIEAASQEAVIDHASNILERCDLMVMSVGALADEGLFREIKKKAKEHGRRVYIPSGALSGLDGIKSAGIGEIREVILTTRKPPKSLEGAPYVVEKDISLRSIRKPTIIFEGNAKEAARWFPQNVNVSVALSLAGIGVEKTKVRIIADPFSDRNVHEVEAQGSFGSMVMRTENVPAPKNPKTSYLAAMSAVRTLKEIKENMKVGT